MRKSFISFGFIICFVSLGLNATSQDSIGSGLQLPLKFLDQTSSRVTEVEKQLTKRTKKTLHKLEREEEKIKKRLLKIDSSAAASLFPSNNNTHILLAQGLSQKADKLSQRGLGNYIPYLDTLKNSLGFIKSVSSITNTDEWKSKLKDVSEKVNLLEGRFDQVASIQQFLRERRQYLKEQLKKYGLEKYLKKMNKDVYYYSQMVKNYKQILSDPKKIEAKAIAILSKIPAFKQFIEKNSVLASVFGVSGSNTAPISLVGVQSRAMVQQLIQNGTSMSGPNSQQFIQQQLQTANSQLDEMKNRISFVDLSGNPEPIPDFTPNTQKGKAIFKRLEYGVNIQFGKINRLLPNTGEFAFSLGYKMNDKGIVGIGSSYKLGLGSNIRNIRFSNQGYGLRGFVDWTIKNGYYVSGGYEKNYLSQLKDSLLPSQVKIWQQSGLLGCTKKYAIGKKRKGYVQLLFDFLSYQNIPRSQPILLRTGVNF